MMCVCGIDMIMGFKEWLMMESTSGIVSLGIPAVIAKIFNRKFGNLAPLLARWFRDAKWHNDTFPKNWWHQAHISRGQMTLSDRTDLYDAAKDENSYQKLLDQWGYENKEPFDSEKTRKKIAGQIEMDLMDSGFFKIDFIQKVISGEIRDLSSYKEMRLTDAQNKFEKKKVFNAENKPIKIYPDGYKWIDVGVRCSYIGSMMRNCGSAMLMSDDPDKTMLALFDKDDKSHIIVTYSPNQHMITGDQGIGSSEPKEKYHDYILDLANHLGAKYDTVLSKTPSLRVKYLLSNLGVNFKKLPIEDVFNSFYSFDIGMQKFYTDGYSVAPTEDVDMVGKALADGKLTLRDIKKKRMSKNELIKTVFSRVHMENLKSFGVKYDSLELMSSKANKS